MTVSLNTTSFQLIIEGVRGDSDNGYAAIDNIELRQTDDCLLVPPEATPKPTEVTTGNTNRALNRFWFSLLLHQGTPATSGPNNFPSCDFEADKCGWMSIEVEGANYLWELISPKECVDLGQPCPEADPNSDAEGSILY